MTTWQDVIANGMAGPNGEIDIPDFSPTTPWPGIFVGHNTCYGIGIIITYDDGTTCRFNEWNCNLIG